MTNSNQHFTSTYARIILSDWRALVKMMTGKEEANLTQDEIDAALEGPLGDFFRQKISAYAKIMQDANRFAKSGEEAFKSLVDSNLPLKSGGEIDKALTELTELTEEHYQEWLSQWQQFAELLIKSLENKKTLLNKIEAEDLIRQESLSELYKRYNDLHLELPRIKSKTMNLENYLYLKTYLAIQSALSRQHLPHEPADIQAILKSLKKDFQSISQAEKALLKSQE